MCVQSELGDVIGGVFVTPSAITGYTGASPAFFTRSEISGLVTLYHRDADVVSDWLSAETDISRETLKRLKAFINADRHNDSPSVPKLKQRNPDIFLKPKITVEVNGERGTLLYTKKPSKKGWAWVAFEHDQHECSVDQIRFLGLSDERVT